MQTSLNALRLALVPSILARNLRNAFRCCHSQSDIYAAAQLSATPISLRDLATFGKQAAREPDDVLLLAAKFLKRELPIRLAHRIVELENLPHGMAAVPSIKTVADWYRQSYAEITNFEPLQSSEDEAKFCQILSAVYDRHGPTLVTIAKGIAELKAQFTSEEYPDNVADDVQLFLDAFYTSRVGIRTLIGQHLALKEPREGYVGIINMHTSPVGMARAAIDDARFMCERSYGYAPDVLIYGADKFTFPYVPSHLHHMLFELMKNSMRAVVENNEDEDKLPPIKVIVSAGHKNEDVVIKISDEGGGIPRSEVQRIFSYFFTTAAPAFSSLTAADFSVDTPLAGLGYGLPLSRVFARYFGGDLQVISMEGYGTDAYLHLSRVGDKEEPLPSAWNWEPVRL